MSDTPREDAIAAIEDVLGDALDGYGDPHAWAVIIADRLAALGAEAETPRPPSVRESSERLGIVTDPVSQRSFIVKPPPFEDDAGHWAEAETPPGPINDHERDCPDCQRVIAEERASWVDLCPDETACKTSGHAAYIVHRWLASPETAEALARALEAVTREVLYAGDRQGEAWRRKTASAILAAMRETGENING